MNYADDRIKEFLTECHEILGKLDVDIVLLERSSSSRELLSEVFRAVHTIKGNCGFFGFSRLEALTHAGEDLLGRLRDGKIGLTPAITTCLLALVDAIRRILASIDAGRSEGEQDDAELIGSLERLRESAVPHSMAPSAAPVEKPPVESRKRDAPELGVTWTADNYLKVDVAHLDKLLNLVGEVVLVRNQLLQLASVRRDRAFQSSLQRLNLITTELQQGVMKTRLQRIESIWSALPRMVRDVAVACGKSVHLVLEGAETELDKSMLEAVRDPLVHLVRNAIDHGIETPASRVARGKPLEGCIRLRAFHENEHVTIEIHDDGAGISLERVRQKAVSLGLVAGEAAGHMSEAEIIDFVFLPGFSTTDRVTTVSGRGVGLDVVKTNISRLAGSVEVESEAGAGTLFRIKIPLTLTIIPAVMVTCAGQRFAIPQAALVEIVKLEEDQTQRHVEAVNGSLLYRTRGGVLPLLHLDRELGLEVDGGRAPNPHEFEQTVIVVLQANGRQFGLIVNDVNDVEEVVVKPLGKLLKGIKEFAGVTILGDGRVVLILDVINIARRASVVTDTAQARRGVAEKRTGERKGNREDQSLLLVKDRRGALLAMPMGLVKRLEEVPRDRVEQVSGTHVMHVRGEAVRLLDLDDLIRRGRSSEPGDGVEPVEEERIPIVHFASGSHGLGVMVGQIIDIVSGGFRIQPVGRRAGVLGTTVLRDRVTEVVDVEGILRAECPEIFNGFPSTETAAVTHA